MLPLMTFIVGGLILAAVLYHSYDTNREQVRTITELNASAYAERLRDDMNRGVAITDALKAIIISENGTIDNFEKASENLMSDFVQSIQIAPDGIVTEIYPTEGNEKSAEKKSVGICPSGCVKKSAGGISDIHCG